MGIAFSFQIYPFPTLTKLCSVIEYIHRNYNKLGCMSHRLTRSPNYRTYSVSYGVTYKDTTAFDSFRPEFFNKYVYLERQHIDARAQDEWLCRNSRFAQILTSIYPKPPGASQTTSIQPWSLSLISLFWHAWVTGTAKKVFGRLPCWNNVYYMGYV